MAILQEMQAKLTNTTDNAAHQTSLASLADLRNQLFVVSQRCRDIYRDLDDEDELPGVDQTELGNLAMSAASLSEALEKTGNSRYVYRRY